MHGARSTTSSSPAVPVYRATTDRRNRCASPASPARPYQTWTSSPCPPTTGQRTVLFEGTWRPFGPSQGREVSMLASIHIADIGFGDALRNFRRRPSTSGLRTAETAIAARFTYSKRPNPDFGRAALIAFWADDDALDRFL